MYFNLIKFHLHSLIVSYFIILSFNCFFFFTKRSLSLFSSHCFTSHSIFWVSRFLSLSRCLSIADAYPLLHVALVTLDATAPLKSTATTLGSSLLNLAMATPTAEGGAAIAGCGIAIAFASHCACNERNLGVQANIDIIG